MFADTNAEIIDLKVKTQIAEIFQRVVVRNLCKMIDPILIIGPVSDQKQRSPKIDGRIQGDFLGVEKMYAVPSLKAEIVNIIIPICIVSYINIRFGVFYRRP